MNLTPKPCCRGDSLEKLNGNIVGAIGAFSQACVNGQNLHQTFEVLLVQGNPHDGFHTRLGDAEHHVHEGRLTEATVSYTLEAFETDHRGDPLPQMVKDSACLRFSATGNLHDFIVNVATQHALHGAMVHVQGVAGELHTFGHTDPYRLNATTQTFANPQGPQVIEGWGNLAFVDGKTLFVHIHGTYENATGRHGGHFIMDEKTHLILEKAELMIFPVPSLVRKIQNEDFPSWVI